MGIGIGIIFATFVMLGVKFQYQMSKSQIEQKARSLGMQYPSDMKVIKSDNGGKK
ncbi:hypothetical protein H2684_04960 [Clostridium sp. cel8]|jgi:hypothetical protein|uniref:hypothetical protein n=1 Tax=unclassified Clostridium TaxID=2614128 RepID=UPI0015F470A9|nr:hypothetical protein [Clostridium sp. cel8]MBA5850671.1 hypothetical protein [Clostridium sp. cel8]